MYTPRRYKSRGTDSRNSMAGSSMIGGLAKWRVRGWIIYHLIAMLISLGILWKENKKAVLNTRFMLLISSVLFHFSSVGPVSWEWL